MTKTVYNSFKNVFTYANGIEKWGKDLYYDASGNKLNYTFCADCFFQLFSAYACGEGFTEGCFHKQRKHIE